MLAQVEKSCFSKACQYSTVVMIGSNNTPRGADISDHHRYKPIHRFCRKVGVCIIFKIVAATSSGIYVTVVHMRDAAG